MRRRNVLVMVACLSVTELAGCSADGGTNTTETPSPAANGTDISVGHNNSYSFSPERTSVSTGTTVTWHFEAPGHNVSCHPDHGRTMSLPDGAEPFSSYERNNKYAVRDAGETFQHTFTVPGTYDYACIPHEAQGMTGVVVVGE